MSHFLSIIIFVVWLGATMQGQAPGSTSAGTFRVKYAAEDSVYLDAGRNAGITEGMSLIIRRAAVLSLGGDSEIKGRIVVATVQVVSVSQSSAMCAIRSKNLAIRPGDLAVLAPRADSAPKPHAAAAERTEPQSFAPLAGSLSERTVVNVPMPENPWKETAPHGYTIGGSGTDSANATVPKSLPEQMAENERNSRRQKASDQNTSKSLAEEVAENARQRRGAGSVAAAQPAPPVTATRSTAQPQQPATNNAEPAATVAEAKAKPPTAKAAEPQPVLAGNAVNTQPSSPAKPVQPPVPTQPTDAQAASAGTQKVSPSIAPELPRTVAAASERRIPTPDTAAKPGSGAPAPTVPEMAKQNLPAATSAAKSAAPATTVVAAARPPDIPSTSRSTTIASPATAPALTPVSGPSSGTPNRTTFKVKYVAEDAIYIDGGKSDGLAEGMALSIRKSDAVFIDMKVASVSNTSAVCEIQTKGDEVQRGDIAQLSQSDQEKLVQAQTLGPTRKYPQVVAFSEGDPLDEEVREAVPKPPLPEINRARGRIGADYSFIHSTGSTTADTYQVGGVVRVDMSRIGGSYWNLNGYWRGRLNSLSSSNQPQSVFDLVNRTYTIGFTYVNPGSHWTAGFGRLYLPWAPSLDTTDGGYLGRRFGSHVTLGVFAGTSPDPASFNYDPDRRTGGTFIAMEGGSFDGVRFTSAEGVAVSAIEWREDRQFLFSENSLFIKRFLSIYHSAQADIQRLPAGGTTEGLARSFATLRVQPFSRFSIDVNHNYFRDVPTFDPNLVGTGLLDKFLFQGVSVGGRLELPGHITIYNNLGQSSKTGDTHGSYNQLYGITLARLWKTGLRGDVRYSKFVSSFGGGNYRAASLSRSFREAVRIEVSAGQQRFLSSLATTTNYQVLGSTIDLNLGGHYFLESGFNLQRSAQQNFDQWLMTMGYRFDTGRQR